MSSLLCVPIMVDEVHEALAAADAARSLGADLVEFRIDTLFQGEGDDLGIDATVRLVEQSPLPCIVTCRPTWEGGLYDGDDAARIALFERLGAMDRPPRYIDVEHQAFTRSANLRQKVRLAVQHPDQVRDLSTSLILSHHDFDGRPTSLNRTLADMREDDTAAVTKLAWSARSLRDNLELFELLEDRDRPTIALGMGRFGLMSRVLAPKFGGFLTFASLLDTTTTAPGQPTIRDLLTVYRFRSIRPSTRVYGVIGWPVEHSMSPRIHNAGFELVDHDGVYLPMPVPPEWEHFKATVLALVDDPRLDFAGASVTIPHKAHLLRLAREEGWTIESEADRVGAANTLIVSPDDIRVANSDVYGIRLALRHADVDVDGRRAVILGAGGAARAAAVALLDLGAKVAVCNRTLENAKALAGDFDGVEVLPWEDRPGSETQLVINSTPVGMSSADDEAATAASPLEPAHLDALPPTCTVFDTIYNPLETRLLRDAGARGLTTIPGLAMFVHQAAGQFEAWTGIAPERTPTALFERIVSETLA